ncbi:MAG: 2-polyprenylphenol 6-hydroxylase [Alphaproteobacteria bacterium]|nr:2-polyprenylphenol 6-hydroxylase [Alphaproteobacteria bacterium]
MLRHARNARRLIRIAIVLARHDALFPLELLGVAPVSRRAARLIARRAKGKRPGQRLAEALVALGPSFIKLGQSLATRPDLLGEEVAADLSALQDKLPPFPAPEARKIIEAQLDAPVETLYRSFEDEPVAAASIAQVHFAVTTEGEEVAVKVLRPGIEAAFKRDLDLFYWIAEWVERMRPSLRRLKPVAVVETFADSVAVEMDLRMEAAAASELGQNFEGDPTFRVPRVDWRRTAQRVLTTERVIGIPVDRRVELTAAGHDVRLILKKAAEIFFKQAFRDGFFHADQHPGNAFVDAEGAIVAVDFGIMGRVDKATRHFLADMLLGFLQADYARVAEVHFRAGYVPAHKDKDAFTQAIRAIAEPILGLPLAEISLAKLLGLMFQVTERFEMETQPQLLLLQKTMLVTEGIGRKLDPTINMWELARPLVEDWMREHRGPLARARESAETVRELVERAPMILRGIERAASDIAEGGVRLHPDTLEALRRSEPPRPAPQWPLWLTVGALGVAVVWLLAR